MRKPKGKAMDFAEWKRRTIAAIERMPESRYERSKVFQSFASSFSADIRRRTKAEADAAQEQTNAEGITDQIHSRPGVNRRRLGRDGRRVG